MSANATGPSHSPDPEVAADRVEAGDRPKRPTRGLQYWLACFLLLLLGLALQLSLLVYAMYVLLAVLAISHHLSHVWTSNVDAHRECSRLMAQIDEQVAVIVTIKNTGRWSIPWLLLEDSLPRHALSQKPPRLRLKRKNINLVRIAKGAQHSLRYQIQFLMRGYYQIGPTLLESGDVFGLNRRFRIATQPHFVLVPPRIVPMPGYDIMSRRPMGEVRITHQLYADPTRVSGVRSYERGDPMNQIHWKTTARTGSLHSKTFEPSTVAGATIVLDFHLDGYTSRAEPHRSELAVTAAASLANSVTLMGQQVGLVTNGRDAADRIQQEGWRRDFRTRALAQGSVGMLDVNERLAPVHVPTRRGRDQMSQILQTLARVELSDGLPVADLLLEMAGRIPRDATLIAILPDATPEATLALSSLRRRGFAVTVILVMYSEQEPSAAAAERLRAAGLDVRLVEDEQMLAACCSAHMSR